MPAEPRLSAIARQPLGRGVSGSELSKLEDAWLPLLQPFPWGEEQANGLRLRGRLLFSIAAKLLGGDPAIAEPTGALWSLADGAFHCSDEQSRDFLLGEAKRAIPAIPRKLSRKLRPLTVLAAVAAHDVLRTGRLTRLGVAMTHRLRGTIPRG